MDGTKRRARKSKIVVRNYGEVIDEEILRLQKISSSIDAAMEESTVSKAEGDKNFKKTSLKRMKSSQPKEDGNATPPTGSETELQEGDIIEPQFKISKIVGNYSADEDDVNVDDSIPMPMPLQFSIKVEIEEFEEDFCIKEVGVNKKISDNRQNIHITELKDETRASTSTSKNIESSENTDEAGDTAQIANKSNCTDDGTSKNKLAIPSKPIIIKLPTKQVNKIPVESEIVKTLQPVKNKAQSLVKLIEMTTNDTEQLIKSIDDLNNDKSSKTECKSSIGTKSKDVSNDLQLVLNEKHISNKEFQNGFARPILDANKKHTVSMDFQNSSTEPPVNSNEKRATYTDTHVLEIDYVLDTAEELYRCNNDPVDKQVLIDFRSYWCRPQVIFDENPEELLLSDVIKKWRYWQNSCKNRELPLSYKCYICSKAWWHLADFRDHIHTHRKHNLRVDIEKHPFECSIISYLGDMPELEDFYIEGKCWKCRHGFEEHALEKRYYDNMYTCYECKKKFYTCTAKRQHEEWCPEHRKSKLLMDNASANSMQKTVTDTFSYICQVCAGSFMSSEDLYDHQIHHHCVRTDIPSLTYAKKCLDCNASYYWNIFHACPSKIEISLCKYCGRNFHKQFLAVIHMNSTKSNVKCKFCRRVMIKECLMMEHLVMEHSDRFMLVYKCRICPKPVVMRTPLAVTRHRKKCHSTVKCNITMVVPIPKKCLSDLSASNVNFSLDEYRQDDEIQIITNTIDKSEVIEILDSDSEEERNVSVSVKTEIFETEDNELQIDEHRRNAIDNEESDMTSANYHNVDIKPITKNNSNITNKFTHDNDIKIKQEILDYEYEKELHNIKQEPDESDEELKIEDMDIMKDENDYENELTKVFQKSKFIDTSNVTDKETPMGIDIKTNDFISMIKAEPIDEDFQDDLIILNANHEFEATQIKEENNPIIKVENYEVDPEVVLNAKQIYNSNFDGNNDVCNKEPKGLRKKHKYFKCNNCNFTGRHKTFKSHVEYGDCESINNNKMNCTKCGVNFPEWKSYLRHFPKHGVPYQTCPQCLESFDVLVNLEKHLQGHVRSTYLRFQSINEQGTSLSSTGRKHKDSKFKCKECQSIIVKTDFFQHWEKHLEIITEMKQSRFVEQEIVRNVGVCKVGAYSSLDAGMLQKVIKNLQGINYKLLKSTGSSGIQSTSAHVKTRGCCVCSRKFNRYNDSKRHLIAHLLEDAYVEKINNVHDYFRCQICNSKHFKIDQYKLHMREHASLPIFRCELCDKSFSDSSNFTKHKKVHNLKVFICNICKKKFQLKLSLEKHMTIHITREPIKCVHCPAIFHEDSFYRKHVRVKHERVPYRSRCVVCGIRFERLKDKWDHMWEKHKLRKIAADCPLCDMTYRKYSDVKKHLSSFHCTVLPMAIILKLNMAKLDEEKYTLLLEEVKNTMVARIVNVGVNSAIDMNSDVNTLVVKEEKDDFDS